MKQPQPSLAPRAGITADQARAISALARTHQDEGAELTEKQFREMTSLQHQIGLTGYTVAELPLGPNTVAYQLTDTAQSFQSDVATWMGQCFPPSLSSNMTERGDRLLEEVLELLQSHGYDSARVPTLVNYVFARPVGEPAQEVGGVMVTLAAYCSVAGLSMQADGQAELVRINQPEVIARIRAKQEAKNALHFDTPLPGSAAQLAQAVDLPYSLDADPAGIRASVCDVITSTLMVGAQGHTPPPAGHWAEPFWKAARADATAHAVDSGLLPHSIRLIQIPGRNSLDPINVFVQDYELGRGRIVVTCYGQAWCGFWGAMGDRTVMQFVAACDADYVAGNMLSGRHERVLKRERDYVERIATEVIAEFRALIDSQAVRNG